MVSASWLIECNVRVQAYKLVYFPWGLRQTFVRAQHN